MVNALGALLTFLVIFMAVLGSLEVGRRLGGRALSGEERSRPMGLGTVETVAFGLLGLLLAFTFSGAASRLDARRAQIVDEANAIGTAWLRVDLVPPAAQPRLREAFRSYTDARIETYRRMTESDRAGTLAAYERSLRLQGDIWAQSVAACREAPPQVALLLLPALNAMIDITSTRIAMREMHPPMVIFVVLGVITLVCALLVGYEMGASPARSWIHIWGFAGILAFTLYAIFDFEYPRLGLIRLDNFDQYIVQVRAGMN